MGSTYIFRLRTFRLRRGKNVVKTLQNLGHFRLRLGKILQLLFRLRFVCKTRFRIVAEMYTRYHALFILIT